MILYIEIKVDTKQKNQYIIRSTSSLNGAREQLVFEPGNEHHNLQGVICSTLLSDERNSLVLNNSG